MKRYRNIISAGTFDHLHIGHKTLLDKAFELAERVSIGITADEMNKSKRLSETIEKIGDRRKEIGDYLREKQYDKRAKIFVLNNIYGPSLRHPQGKRLSVNQFDSLLVTKETLRNGQKVNVERQRRGLKPLELVVETLVLADDGRAVTSERIRMGEIDRNGNCYSLFVNRYLEDKRKEIRDRRENRKQLILPEGMREELRKPLGEIINFQLPITNIQSNLNFQIPNEEEIQKTAERVVKSIKSIESIKPPLVIAVGDIITLSLLREKYIPDISIIDLRSRREDLKEMSKIKYQISKLHIKDQKEVTNKPGSINIEAARIIQNLISQFVKTNKKQAITVKGEEDLLALPGILFAPLHSIVLYGQWNLGVVMVEVTEERKKHVQEILKRFV